MNILISLLLRGLGPINEYKAVLGVALTALYAGLEYFDTSHPALAILAAVMTGLGVGHKMGKHPNPDDGSKPWQQAVSKKK